MKWYDFCLSFSFTFIFLYFGHLFIFVFFIFLMFIFIYFFFILFVCFFRVPVTAGAKSGVMLLFPAFPEPKCRGKNRWKKREEKDIDERVYLGDINHLSVSSGNSIISVTSLIHHWLGGQAWHYDLKESGLFPNPSLPTSFTSSLCLGNSIFLCSHPFPGE